MNRAELRKLIVGPIATVPTPFDKDFHVDYGRMYDLAQGWIDNGLVRGKSVIKVAAAMGEGPMLRDDEWPYLLKATTRAVGDSGTVVCGLHYKDTVRTIEDAKRAQDMGAVALQVCPPIFNLPSQDDLLDYFGELSDAIDIGIMVYHTYWMPGGRIEIDTIMKMEEFEQVASIKWSCPDDVDNDEIARFTPIFNVIANGNFVYGKWENGNIVRCHQLGARGYINLTAEAYPPHDLKLWDLMENGKYEEAAELDKSVDGPLREFSAKVDTYSGGQGRVKKGIMALMGQPVGTSRPPSKPLKETDLEDLRNILLSFNWPVQATAKEAASQ